MNQRDLPTINWTAVFVGFGVDWTFSFFVGFVVMAALLAITGSSLEAVEESLPLEVDLAVQIVGVAGAWIGGTAAGYVARQSGKLHGLLGSLLGLPVAFCVFRVSPDLAYLGFLVLNLLAAWYGGGAGERWRSRRGEPK